MARRFRNWARTVSTKPTGWSAPASEDEVASIVRGASERVRVVGAAHSWSAIAAPSELAMSLDGLAGVTIDRAAGVARVLGGTRLHALNAALADADLALPIVGSIAAQSIAGMIATGTHGSSLVHGNLSSLVRAVRLVTGRGDVLELGAGDPRLDGARVHLGALGIVTEVTLAVVPAFRLAETIETIELAKLPSELATIAASAEYCKVWWLPPVRRAHVFRYERTAELASPRAARDRWLDESVMHRFVFPLALRLGRLPGLYRPIARGAASSFERPRRVGPSALMLSTPMPARHRETEAALPLARAGEAIDRVVRAIERDRLAVNFPLEIRFVRGDSGWLTPAHGADTCQIGAYCHGPATTPYFAAFWRELRALEARPHWGKELDHIADELRGLWPEWTRFGALRDELDPERRFATPFTARTLGA